MKIWEKLKDWWLLILQKNLQEKVLKKIAAHDQTLHITCAIEILKPTGDSQYKVYQ